MSSCGKCPSSGYEYCKYSYNSTCNEKLEKYGKNTSGVLQPSQSIPWLTCTSRGQCTLFGRPIVSVTTTTTTTIPGGPERICEKRTTSCYSSCKKCPTEYNGMPVKYCEYSYNSLCNEKLERNGIKTSGILSPGQNLPWLVCTSSGNCTLDVYY